VKMADGDSKPLLAGDEKSQQTCGAKVLDFVTPPPCPWPMGHYVRLGFVLALILAVILAAIFHKALAEFFGADICNVDGTSCCGSVCAFSNQTPNFSAVSSEIGNCALGDLGCSCRDGTLASFIEKVGWWGPVIYSLVYMACTVAFIPGSVLTLAAGIIFADFGGNKWEGLAVSFATISIGSTVGSFLAFLLGRTVLRDWVQKKIEPFPIFKAIDHAISNKGFVMVLLLRLSPAIPFNLLNYALALTSVHPLAYVVASWVGMMPGTFLYIYIPWAIKVGATSGTGCGSEGKAGIIKSVLIYGVGSLATIAVVVAVTLLARRAIQKSVKELKEIDEANPSTNENKI